jgi:hypothetical protein
MPSAGRPAHTVTTTALGFRESNWPQLSAASSTCGDSTSCGITGSPLVDFWFVICTHLADQSHRHLIYWRIVVALD